jgi:amidase
MNASDDLGHAGLVEIGELISRRAISSSEVTEHIIARIEALNPVLNAFASVSAEAAILQSRTADQEIARGVRRGPLHGVPVAVKDLLFTRDFPTANGMRIFAGWQSDEDATAVACLRRAGAVIIGKTQMTEGATLDHHPDVAAPVNPWNVDRSSGFSSSGSGAAVAAGLCYGALGSDTGGSIRIPSAMNGVTGLKPTWGRVSRHGVFPLVEYLDTIGPLARSAVDAAAMLGAIAGPDSKDPTAATLPVPDYLASITQSVRAVRVGINVGAIERCCDPQVVTVVREAAESLAAAGAGVCPVTMPDFDMAAISSLISVGVADAHRATYPSRSDDYGPALKQMLEQAHMITGMDVAAAINRANMVRGQLADLFTKVDLILVPALTKPTPKVGALERAIGENPASALDWLRFTGIFNVSGHPTITLPGGSDTEGMPIGVQLVGRHFEEELLLRAGHAFQCTTGWHAQHPALG